MEREIKYSPKAVSDLDEIWNYIETELYNISAAENTVNGIMDKIENLSLFPQSGVRLEFENGLESGYRFIIFKNYLVFYHLPSDHTVYIDRVLYARRDYMRILFPDAE